MPKDQSLICRSKNIELLSKSAMMKVLRTTGGGAWQSKKARLKERNSARKWGLGGKTPPPLIRRCGPNARYAQPPSAPQHHGGGVQRTFPNTETDDQFARDRGCSGRSGIRQPDGPPEICGDVAGKTEVAMRAAFIAAMCGRGRWQNGADHMLPRQHFKKFVRTVRVSRWKCALCHGFVQRQGCPKRTRDGIARANGGISVVAPMRCWAKGVSFQEPVVIIDEEQQFRCQLTRTAETNFAQIPCADA